MALAAPALELILVNGTTYYVALGTSVDLLTQTMEELTDATYARKGHSAWLTSTSNGVVSRKNNGAIVFDAVTSGIKSITWWAIFTAAEGGDMLAAGPLLNLDGEPAPVSLNGGDQLRFNDGELAIVATPEAV